VAYDDARGIVTGSGLPSGAALSRATRRFRTRRNEGTIPRELWGSLYRNGPGLFDLGGLRKAYLLDDHGLVQRLSFADGTVHTPRAQKIYRGGTGSVRCDPGRATSSAAQSRGRGSNS
jgi:hypothetical protein